MNVVHPAVRTPSRPGIGDTSRDDQAPYVPTNPTTCRKLVKQVEAFKKDPENTPVHPCRSSFCLRMGLNTKMWTEVR